MIKDLYYYCCYSQMDWFYLLSNLQFTADSKGITKNQGATGDITIGNQTNSSTDSIKTKSFELVIAVEQLQQ